MAPPIRNLLVDDMVEAYVEWREECLTLTRAYEHWSRVPVAERGVAFSAYRAALDREQQASSVYAERSRRVTLEFASRPALDPAHSFADVDEFIAAFDGSGRLACRE